MRLKAKTVLTSVFGVSLAIWAVPIVSAAEPPPIPTATVTSDGRILEIVATGAAGTDGTLGDGAVVEGPANHDQIGPLALVTNQTIIGKDNRTKVADTTSNPARMVALMTYAGSQWCTGFLVGPATLITSGHCVFNITTGTWYDPAQMTVYLGYDSSRPNPAPYGSCGVGLLLSTTGWTTYHSDEYDYGAVKLTCSVGYQTGWFGWWHQSASLNGTQSRNHGYPVRQGPVAVALDRPHQGLRSAPVVLRQRHLRRQQWVTRLRQAGVRRIPMRRLVRDVRPWLRPLWLVPQQQLQPRRSGEPGGLGRLLFLARRCSRPAPGGGSTTPRGTAAGWTAERLVGPMARCGPSPRESPRPCGRDGGHP